MVTKKTYHFLIVLLCCLPLMAQPSLKIITYNLRGMKTGTDWETRLFYIIQDLKTLDPALIGLQEINETINGGGADNMARTIADSLETYFGIPYQVYYKITHTAWDQFYESIGIISKYPVEQEGYQSLITGVFPRKVVWNYVDTPLGKIHFFNTHLSYLPEHNLIREIQVGQIIDYIAQQTDQYSGIGAILTGDFNSTPTTSAIKLLTQPDSGIPYWDTWTEANPGNPGYTVPAGSPNARIDYVFYRSDGQLTIDSSALVFTESYDGASYNSDHLGVMTIFSHISAGVNNKEAGSRGKSFSLRPNYPNPFNGYTDISYHLEKKEQIVLKVFSIDGQEVVTLVDTNHAPGDYLLRWNAEELSSGVYILKMSSGELTETRKMILIK